MQTYETYTLFADSSNLSLVPCTTTVWHGAEVVVCIHTLPHLEPHWRSAPAGRGLPTDEAAERLNVIDWGVSL